LAAEDILAAAEEIKAAGECSPKAARDPVNLPMINNWVEAMGDANPVYVDESAARQAGHPSRVAPPAMIQVWTMGGLHQRRPSDDPLARIMQVLDDAGFTSIVATNCQQTYHRYLAHGEQLMLTTSLQDVVGPKRTALGEGWFVTTRNIWYVGDEPVAEMMFRVLKFRPEQGTGAPDAQATNSGAANAEATDAVTSAQLRPVISHDTAFFWEGTAVGELRIQHCPTCGTLRHPPGPMCPTCGADKPDYIVAGGRGTVFSYVVHHHPQVPGKTLPFVVALVELDEGVRMLGELIDVDPARVAVGMPVEIALKRIDDELTMPNWRPTQASA
jgi:hypothetical protein